MDFTLEAYSRLLDALSGYNIVTVEDFLSGKASEPFCVLRHDVDRFPSRASRMARLEKRLGVRATYYFRWLPEAAPDIPGEPGFPAKEVIECKLFGHEVGYHYENLSALAALKENGGKNPSELQAKALEDFASKLALLREIAPVWTAAMHGAPRSKVDNSELLRGVELAQYGILGEPYLSPQFTDVTYITDSGRTWSSGEASVRDRLGKPLEEKVKSTDALIELLNSRKYPRLMVRASPHRWAAGTFERLLDTLKRV